MCLDSADTNDSNIDEGAEVTDTQNTVKDDHLIQVSDEFLLHDEETLIC